MEEPTHPVWNGRDRLAVWVFFTARELTAAERARGLAEAEAALAPKAVQRRAKVTPPGRRLVDERDLPLDPSHLSAAAATGARLRQQSRWLGAASYDATASQVEALAALPCVRRVELVRSSVPRDVETVEAPTAPKTTPDASKRWTLDYGASLAALELINVPPVHELGYTGAGVTVAMLDTGFHMAHEALDHIPIVAQYDFAGDDTVVDTEPGDAPNTHVHGTMVISAIMGYEPGEMMGPAFGVSAILVRAEDAAIEQSPIEEDWWVAGLEWAEAQGAELVSSSLGFWTFYVESDLDGDTAPSTVAADMAAERGLLVVNGAGNQGGTAFDVIVAPADGDSVLAVGATDDQGLIGAFSSSGPTYDGRTKPDVAAQGMQVTAADPYDDHAYTTTGGTSLSGPFAAGVAALMLERAPFLTPVQIIEAFHATSDHHDNPDNHYGWGIVDALGAVFYWGPHIQHEELPDTEDLMGPYVVTAIVDDAFTLQALSPSLLYRVDGGLWQEQAMTPGGGDLFTAEIPGQANGSTIEYYLQAVDVEGLSVRSPFLAPDSSFSFSVLQDTIPPVLSHSPLGDQRLASWPPAVVASATDNVGIAGVEMRYSVNGGPESEPYPLIHGLGDTYARTFPLNLLLAAPGDSIRYTITARDASAAALTTESGPHAFEILAGLVQVLIMDNGSGGEAATVATWLGDAGYGVSIENASSTVAGDLDGKQLVVFLAGSNSTPLSFSSMRLVVRNWVNGGGKLLIEGGETGWAALVYPGDPAFASQVLHATEWLSDSAGDLAVVAGQEGHALLIRPSSISTPLTLNYSSEPDQDAVSPAPEAQLVLENSGRPSTAGALVYDDHPLDPAAQVVYYPFALSALDDQAEAHALVLNAVDLLLDNKTPTAVQDDPIADRSSNRPLARLLGVVPNPFNARAVAQIEISQATPLRLQVYDVRGRMVRDLLGADTLLGPGRHEIHWDGRDDTGRELSSGLYFVRLATGDVVESRKLVLVK